MPIADVPPILQDRIVCSIVAAVKYEVPANIIIAIAEMENGRPGQKVQNSNGTEDVGVMQFNTSYLADLKKYNITAEDVAGKGCYPYELAAWRIRGHILHDSGTLWQRVANYHSRTPEFNEEYQGKLKSKAYKWAMWLQKHFQTRSATTLAKKLITPSKAGSLNATLEPLEAVIKVN